MDDELLSAAQQHRLDALLQAHLPEFIAALSAGLSPVKGGGGGGVARLSSEAVRASSPHAAAASSGAAASSSMQRSFSAVDLHEPQPQQQSQHVPGPWVAHARTASTGAAAATCWRDSCSSSDADDNDSLECSFSMPGGPAPAASSSATKQQRRQQHFLQWRHQQQQQAGHPMLWRPDATLQRPTGVPVGEGREEQEPALSPAGSTGSCPGPAPAATSAATGGDGSPRPSSSRAASFLRRSGSISTLMHALRGVLGAANASGGSSGRQQLEVRVPSCPNDLDVRDYMACFSPDAAAASKQLSRCSSTASAASSAMMEQHTAAAGGLPLQEETSGRAEASPCAEVLVAGPDATTQHAGNGSQAAAAEPALPQGPLHSGLQAAHGGAGTGLLPLSPSPTKRSMLLHGPSRLSFRSSVNDSVDDAAAAAPASPRAKTPGNPLARNSSPAALQQPLTQGLQQLKVQQQQGGTAQEAAPEPAGTAEAPSEHLDHHQQQPQSPVRRPLFARMMGSKLHRSTSAGHKQQQQQAAAMGEPAGQPALKQQAKQWLRRHGGSKQPNSSSMAVDGVGGVQAAAGGSGGPEQAAHTLVVAQREAAMGASQALAVQTGDLQRANSSNSRPQGSVDAEPSLSVVVAAPSRAAAPNPGTAPPSPAAAPHSPAFSNSGSPAVVALADGMQRIASCLEDFLADARSRSVSPVRSMVLANAAQPSGVDVGSPQHASCSPAAKRQGGASISGGASRRDQGGSLRAAAGSGDAQPVTTPSKPALQPSAAAATGMAWSPAAAAAKARMLAAGSPSKQRQQQQSPPRDDTRGCSGRPAAAADQNTHPGDLSHHHRQPAVATAARHTSGQQPDPLRRQLPRGLQPPPGIVGLSAAVQQQQQQLSAVPGGGDRGGSSSSPEPQVNTLLALASRAAGVDLLQQQPAASVQMVAVGAGGMGASHVQQQMHPQPQLWRPGSPGEGERAHAVAGAGWASSGAQEVGLSSPAGSSSSGSSDRLADLPAPAATGQHMLRTHTGSSGGRGGSSVRCLMVAGDVKLMQPARVDTLRLLRPGQLAAGVLPELSSTAPQQQQPQGAHESSTAMLWRSGTGASQQWGGATTLSQQQQLTSRGAVNHPRGPLGPNRLVRLPAHKPAAAPLQPPVLLRPTPAPAMTPWQQQQPGSRTVPWQALSWARQQPGAGATGDGSLADRAAGRGSLTAGHAAARLLRNLGAQEDECDAQAVQDARLQQQQQRDNTGARAPWLPAAGQSQEQQRWAERPEQQWQQRPDDIWSVPAHTPSSSAGDAPQQQHPAATRIAVSEQQQQQRQAPWQLPEQQQAAAGPTSDASKLSSSCGAARQRPAHHQQQQWHFKPRARSPVKRSHTACSSPSKNAEGSKRWALLQRLKTRSRAAGDGGGGMLPGVNGAALLAARQGQSEVAQRLIQQLQMLMLPPSSTQGAAAAAGAGGDDGFRPDLNAAAAMALHHTTPQHTAEQQQEPVPVSRQLSAARVHSCSSSQRVLEQQASCHSAAAQTDALAAAAPSEVRDAGVQVAGNGEQQQQPREAAEELAQLILGAFERSGGCIAPDADTTVLSSSMWSDSAATAAAEPLSSWGADGLLPNPRASAAAPAFREVVDLRQPPGTHVDHSALGQQQESSGWLDRPAAQPGMEPQQPQQQQESSWQQGQQWGGSSSTHAANPGCCFAACPHHMSSPELGETSPQQQRSRRAAGDRGASASTSKRAPTAGSSRRQQPGASGSRAVAVGGSRPSGGRGSGPAAAALSRQPSGRTRRQPQQQPHQQQQQGGGGTEQHSTNTWASQQTQQLDQLWQQWATQQQLRGTESQQAEQQQQAEEAIKLAAAEQQELAAAYARASAARAAAKRQAMQAAADRSQRFKKELQDLSTMLSEVDTLAEEMEADSGAAAAVVKQYEAEMMEG